MSHRADRDCESSSGESFRCCAFALSEACERSNAANFNAGRRSPFRLVAFATTGCIALVIGCVQIDDLIKKGAAPGGLDVAKMQQSAGPLKQSHAAVQAHHDAKHLYPLTGSESPTAKQQLSWRVAVLPYLGEPGLYDQMSQKEPWNSPANAAFHSRMPAAYQSPHRDSADHKTVILAPVTPNQERGNTVLRSEKPGQMSFIFDGTFNTIMLVEADSDVAVEWMRPADLNFDPAQPKRGLGHLIPGGFCAVFVNGAVRFITNDVDDHVLAALMRCDEGQPVDLDAAARLVAQ